MGETGSDSQTQGTKGAVFRVNEALQGSRINEQFSRIVIEGKEDRASNAQVIYCPRTVTVYESEEHARAAAKLLRMLTSQSGVTIRAEPLERGMDKPIWVVSDTMNLETHNALRLIFTHFASKELPEIRSERTRNTQAEVDKRLSDGEQWEALEGVSTFLTLAGRPGVKMYKRLDDGKDDPSDVEAVNAIPGQDLPIYVRGVPHRTIFAPDGRRYMKPGDSRAIIEHLLLGPKGYAYIHGGKQALGHVISDKVKEKRAEFNASSAYEKGQTAADLIYMATDPIEAVISYGGGILGVLLTGGAMLVCAGSYQSCKKLSEKLSRGKWVFDPIEKSFLPYVIENAGDPRKPSFGKTWAMRQTGEGIKINPDEISVMVVPGNEQSVATPLGDIPLRPAGEKAQIKWVRDLPHSVGKEFSRYMAANNLWPTPEAISDNGNLPLPRHGLNGEYTQARDRLAVAYAKWIEDSRRHLDRRSPHASPPAGVTLSTKEAMLPSSTALAEALNDFVASIQSQTQLPSHTANHIIAITRKSLQAGMEGFLSERQLMANRP